MAGKAFIADIRDRDRVSGAFLIQQKQVPLNKNGKPYIAMVLMDRTGTVEGRVWDNAEQIAPTIEAGDFVDVRGVAVSYQGRVQVKVEKVKKIASDSVDLEEFLHASSRDRGEMLNRLQSLLEGISDPVLRRLVLDRLHDDDFRKAFPEDYYHNSLNDLPMMESIHSLDDITLAVATTADDVSFEWLLTGQARFNVKVIMGIGSNYYPSFTPYIESGQIQGALAGMKGAAEYEKLLKEAKIIPELGEATQGMATQSSVQQSRC